MMPVMAFDLLDAIELLAAGTRNFAEKLVDGLEADRPRAEGFVEQSLAMGTALTGEIGYEKAAVLVEGSPCHRPHDSRCGRDKSGIPEERLNSLLNPQSQVGERAEKG